MRLFGPFWGLFFGPFLGHFSPFFRPFLRSFRVVVVLDVLREIHYKIKQNDATEGKNMHASAKIHQIM